MMPLGKWARLVGRNTVRSPKHFVLSAFGIVVGIASFVFFLGLSMGVRNVVLGKIFPLEKVEVEAPRISALGADLSKRLDDAVVEEIRARKKWVTEVVPRMTLTFPASGSGWIDESEFQFPAGGFTDGIAPSYVADDPELAEMFRDWEDPANKGEPRPCTENADCEPTDRWYCPAWDNVCHHRVPVIVSPTMLELYNGQFATSHGLPMVSELEAFMLERGGLSAMRFYLHLGTSVSSNNGDQVPAATGTGAEKRTVEGLLLGISPKAMPIGMTMPIDYVERWNREYAGEDAATAYSTLVVTLREKDDVAPFAQWLREDLELQLKDSMGERFATAIFIVTSLFVLISLVIVGISAINIAHNFYMQVSERRRELGILRAIGATRGDVRRIILGEAALIGIMGGVIGVGLAVAAGWAVDEMSRAWLPRFPFKPDTYFDFQPWIVVSGMAFAVLFCVLGGFLPARRAARMEPAQALTAQ